MKSSSTLRKRSLLNRSSISNSQTDQELWENCYFRGWGPWYLSKISPWWWFKARASRVFYCFPPELCKYPSELHDFFRVFSPSSKLHDFYVYSSSTSMKLCKLSSELYGKIPKKSVLMLIRKKLCFWKVYDFGSFFTSQWKAPQKLTIYVQNCCVLCAFLCSEMTATRKACLLKDSSHILTQELFKMAPSKIQELSV